MMNDRRKGKIYIYMFNCFLVLVTYISVLPPKYQRLFDKDLFEVARIETNKLIKNIF